MKFGVRKFSPTKSLKARTTGKVKRSLKKAVNPLYGKKGMGVINNPKKAMYNKVYNQASVGLLDLLKSEKKTVKKNRPSGDLISALNATLESVNKLSGLIDSANTPKAFFNNYDLYMEKLSELASAENSGIKFEGDSPSEKHSILNTEKEKIVVINKFIDRFWKITQVKVDERKTEKGKANQIAKYHSGLKEYEYRFPPACIDYYKSKSGQ